MSIFNKKKYFSALLYCAVIISSIILRSNKIQAQCGTSLTGNISEFNFSAQIPSCAEGIASTSPFFQADMYTYCPNISNGCGKTFLGSRGHANTGYFANAICMLNFYDINMAVNEYGGAGN